MLWIEYPKHTETVRRPLETCGILAASLESGFADLEDVVPRLHDVPVSPGFAGYLETGAERWTASVFVHGDKTDLTVMLTLCDPGGSCVEHRADGIYDSPSVVVGALLGDAAKTLDRPPAEGAAAQWSVPHSPDPYAVMIAGRGAAHFYGKAPPLEPEAVGDRKKDPIIRAIYLDPAMAVGQWIAGRRAVALGRSGRAEFARAAVLRPSSLLFQSDAAAALRTDGDSEGALAAWQAVDLRSPKDPRFVVERARAALALERYALATTTLDGLREGLQDDRTVVELRVAIADATGAREGHDELLRRWELAAPEDAEPVRRRLALRVEQGRYREALEFTEELTARGARREANEAAMALAVGLREWDLAAREAESLGQHEVSADLTIRAEIERGTNELPAALLADTEPAARLVEGGLALRRAQPERALALASALLQASPWSPEALALRLAALEALGRSREAEEARATLRLVDPAWGQGRAWAGGDMVASLDGGAGGGDEAGPGAGATGAGPSGADGGSASPPSGTAGGGASSGTEAAAESSAALVPNGATSATGGSGPNTPPGSTGNGAQSQPTSP